MNADSFEDWMLLGVRQLPQKLTESAQASCRTLISNVQMLLLDETQEFWQGLPRVIRQAMLSIGWQWNGIYELQETKMVLRSAAGPPVCHELEISGGVGTSGMCYDCILTNQTLVASSIKDWPGYVSCDGESGLQTISGMVCPIQNKTQQIVAVWDLDSTQQLPDWTPLLMDRMLRSLALIHPWNLLDRA